MSRPGDGADLGEFEAVIGLEVHAQMLTASKLFCGCSASFGAPPNAHTCPVCLGMPGMLPVVNRRAVELALRTAIAAGCEIPERARWARKNYFYPDIPKGYQISMYEEPLAIGGSIEIQSAAGPKRIRLVRIHMEEDAGKNVHDAHADHSLVDLNRAGVPLMEIVSEPDLSSPAEATAYLRALRSLLRYLEVCDGNLEEGSLRCDANVSVRRRGSARLGTRTEIKNMNSFRSVERAIEWEIRRQVALVAAGDEVVQETRHWDAEGGRTISMRSKEDAHDYRYFPEPDLLPLEVPRRWIEEIRAGLPELPAARRSRFEASYGLSAYDADVLTARRDLADYFEAAARFHADAKAVANWVMGELLRVIRERRLDDALMIERWPLRPERLAGLLGLVADGTISGRIAKQVFELMLDGDEEARAIVEREGLLQVSDADAIEAAVRQVLSEHADKVAEYRAGKEKLLGFFVGQVMKATGGKANPRLANEILRRELAP